MNIETHTEKSPERRIDKFVRDSSVFLGRAWTIVPGTRIKMWHLLSVVAFIFGAYAALSFVVANRGGSASRADTMTLPPPPPLPTFPAPQVTLSASPGTIDSVQSSTISWSSSNTSSCSASDAWSGSKALSGSESVTPSQTSTYTLTCAGSFGGSASKSVSVTVNPLADTTPPTVSITAPKDGSTYTSAQTVSIVASASDSGGIDRVEFYDGSILKKTDSSSPYDYSWDISSSDNGNHSWTAKAYDAAGNSKTSSSVGLTVNISTSTADTVSPTVALTSPVDGSTVIPGSMIPLAATASDNVGVTRVDFLVNGSVKCSDTSLEYTCNWKVPKANTKSYSFQAKAYDAAGNVATSSTITVNALR